MEVVDDKYCFACGKENPVSLKMEFKKLGTDIVHSEIIISKNYQGWEGIVHGGIVATMLDEAAAYLCGHLFGTGCVTAEINVKYRKPTPTNEKISIYAELKEKKRNILYIKSFIKFNDEVTAEAEVKMFQLEKK